MPEYKHPGVYIEEIPHLPPSIASVETAIPCFIGYTEIAQWKAPKDLHNKPWRIESMLEYEQYYGNPDSEKASLSVTITTVNNTSTVTAAVDETKKVQIPDELFPANVFCKWRRTLLDNFSG